MPARRSRSSWSPRWRLLLALLLVLNIVQCLSLVRRVSRGATDFTVFFNTSRLLSQGAGAELYAQHDQSTDWMRTIPPFGQMIFQPIVGGTIQTAAIAWGAFNLALLGAALATLTYFGRRLDAKSRLFGAACPAMGAVWLALAPGSIQVGQFSVLFAAFWIFFLGLRASPHRRWAAAALAVPAGIKLYPVVLPALFLFQRRPKAFGVAMLFVALTLALPFLAYGPRTPALTRSFWKHAIASDASRINESQRANSISNQGLDSILLRYLTSGQKLHARNPNFPHLDIERATVLQFTHLTRLLVVLLSAIVAWRSWPRLEKTPLWGTFLLLALGCATLYVLIPGTKSRYAIYAFLAFVPLILQALSAQKMGKKRQFWGWSATITLLLLLLLQFVPPTFRLYGVCFGGHLTLWALNLSLLWRVATKPTPISLDPITAHQTAQLR